MKVGNNLERDDALFLHVAVLYMAGKQVYVGVGLYIILFESFNHFHHLSLI